MSETAIPAGAGEGADWGAPPTGALDAYLPLLRRLEEAVPVDEAASKLVDGAVDVWSRPGFDTLVSVPRLRFDPFPHQLDAAVRVLRSMQGRALLADEVGLGKTIEAALVATELRIRRLASRVLVLVPAGLVGQWQEELDRKFGLPSVVPTGSWPGLPDGAGDGPLVVASLAAARRSPLRDVLCGESWDLVIVDEAHRVKNPRSVSAKLVRGLRTRYLLLLTATPVENRLGDLFELVNLVRPGHLGTPQQFRSRHGSVAAGSQPRNIDPLRARLRDVMVRHRRSEVQVMLPQRLAETVGVVPDEAERELYSFISGRVRREGRAARPGSTMALNAVQRMAGSSAAAVAAGLTNLGWHDAAEAAAEIAAAPGTKAAALVERLARHGRAGEKVVVFTAFRRTVEHLSRVVSDAGLEAVTYHGSLSRREKDAAVAAFAGDVPILLTTEAAGEGRNLQFCHVMVNFDLPWNPMQIEQRLGRIHRIGQTDDVLVTNLVARGTIEERILGVLEAKINLFELVVGELDMILGHIDDDFDFESFVFGAHVASADDGEFGVRLDELGDDLAKARAGYLGSRECIDELVGEQP